MLAITKVVDALKRGAFTEAQRYIADVTAEVQNEIDWCYRTDFVAPFLLEFFLQLGDTLETFRGVSERERAPLVKETIEVLEDMFNRQVRIEAECAAWNAPDKHVDVLEAEHRARLYGKVST